MTPEDITRIEATLPSLHADPDRFGRAFYERLFDLDPGARRLFTTDMGEQRAKLVAELEFLGDAVRDLDAFVERARELGVRHRTLGVEAVHYRTVEHALMAGIAAALGDRLDPDTAAAWSRLYWLVAETMMEAATSAIRP